MPPLRRALATATLIALAALSAAARADEPPRSKSQQVPRPDGQTDEPSKPLQIASDPPPPPPPPPRASDGAGPRITFGRTWTDRAKDGFYGRFESEYFEVRGSNILGGLVGLEGWGAEGAKAGGGSIVAGGFFGNRAGAMPGEHGASFLFTVGAGLHVIVFDKMGREDGFGLFSPYGSMTMGIEPIAGLRFLCDARAVYRWHWTARSEGQIQVGGTLSLNSYLWDGP